MATKHKKDVPTHKLFNFSEEMLAKKIEVPEPFDIQPALHFDVKAYRKRLQQEKEERKRIGRKDKV